MESSIIILNSFNGNFYFSNPARNNNPVRILVMQYKTLQQVNKGLFPERYLIEYKALSKQTHKYLKGKLVSTNHDIPEPIK